MARYYTLLPLPLGVFAEDELTLIDRAVFGMIYDRWKLSNYTATGSASYETPYYDEQLQDYYCIFSHDELSRQVGVNEKTIRRSLDKLRTLDYVYWTKRKFKGANCYFITRRMKEYMSLQRQLNKDSAKSPQSGL